MRIAFKPTATIRIAQDTVDSEGSAVVLEAGGRHDPCVLPRAVPMVEAMTCLVLADHWLRQRATDVLRSVGGQIRDSWCGPCFGQGPDALKKGQRAITSFNRNWQNRMGLGGEGFLASPAVVAASALLGYMAPPGELGLDWNPQTFGI